MAASLALRRSSLSTLRNLIPISGSVQTFLCPVSAIEKFRKDTIFSVPLLTSTPPISNLLPNITRGLSNPSRGLSSTSFRNSNADPSPEQTPYSDEEVNNHSPPVPELVYEGLLSTTVHRVKMLSVASCFLTTVGAPVIVGLSRPDLAFGMQVATATSLAMFGLFTTGVLQWFISPYVLRMHVVLNDDPGCKALNCKACLLLKVTRLTMFARETTDDVLLSSIVPTNTFKPLATFQARNRIYFFDKSQWNPEMHRDTLNQILTLAGEEDLQNDADYDTDDENTPTSK
mmetsp:Transcript_32638/g.45300  ORF Transcript_32638/g.45300 Transcript_32638/m.45300 type:complete len:287 (+) Transcript_32638:164-1024(+)|eukprot:CAMPEP_0196595920 /NCGR_PEP_ID=MMETSP1081-20130531/83150_1 /TAXON_ID=36882 /ORGANISM="Pyramimonas amylifera, Strain CCMP720" /LENGTH=286 /DNA_ID=CAMNT_0041920705 /DNA_START=130 /DNA_END=990 /DNA_ORIENTATION=-